MIKWVLNYASLLCNRTPWAPVSLCVDAGIYYRRVMVARGRGQAGIRP